MNISGVDLNLLQVFDALMTERSVTRAGAKIGLSQPALSNALTRLRDGLHDRLFVRGRKTMVPTPRALELAPAISAALQHIRSAFQGPEFSPGSSIRAFRLATTDETELTLLPDLARKLDAVAPCITVSCSRLERVFRLPQIDLESGVLDFAIGAFPHPMPIDSGCFAQVLYDESFVCIVRRGHPTVTGRLSLGQFCKLRHVVTYYPGEGPGMIDRILVGKRHERITKVSLPHFLSIPYVVAGSDLIATVPALVADAFCSPLHLQRIKCPIVFPRMKVSLVWHARTHENAAHRWFRNLVADVCRNLMKEH